MTYPKHLFKSPGAYGSGDKSYDVAGAADEDQELSLLERGWHETKEAAWESAPAPEPIKGIPALRVEYQTLAGKKPFPGWNEAKLREKIAELGAK